MHNACFQALLSKNEHSGLGAAPSLPLPHFSKGVKEYRDGLHPKLLKAVGRLKQSYLHRKKVLLDQASDPTRAAFRFPHCWPTSYFLEVPEQKRKT